jgi:hypothetical protein
MEGTSSNRNDRGKKRQRPGIRKFLIYVWKTKQACGFPVHADFKEEESQLPL